MGRALVINQMEIGHFAYRRLCRNRVSRLAGDQGCPDGSCRKYAYSFSSWGYYVWQRVDAHREKSALVSSGDVELGVDIAMQRFHEDVLSRPCRRNARVPSVSAGYVCDDGRASRPPAIAARMGRTASATSSLGAQLLQRQVISAHARLRYVAIPLTGTTPCQQRGKAARQVLGLEAMPVAVRR